MGICKFRARDAKLAILIGQKFCGSVACNLLLSSSQTTSSRCRSPSPSILPHPTFRFIHTSSFPWPRILVSALAVELVVAGARRTRVRSEMVGQGVGNAGKVRLESSRKILLVINILTAARYTSLRCRRSLRCAGQIRTRHGVGNQNPSS